MNITQQGMHNDDLMKLCDVFSQKIYTPPLPQFILFISLLQVNKTKNANSCQPRNHSLHPKESLCLKTYSSTSDCY